MSLRQVCQENMQHKKWAEPSEKGAYDSADVMQANDVNDVIYDVTVRNIKHATQIVKQNTVTFIF